MSVFKKIVLFLIPLMLFIAIIVKSAGVDYLAFDNKYWSFASRLLTVHDALTIAIPNIPPIPTFGNDLLDFVFGFLNTLSNIFNILINIVNIIVDELVFVLSFITTIFEAIRDYFLGGRSLPFAL